MPRTRLLLTATATLGAASMTTQLVLMRELWETLGSNELVLGITLGSWLLLTGIGSAFAGLRAPGNAAPEGRLGLKLAALALVPFALVLALRAGRPLLLLPGEIADAPRAMLASVLLLAPYCLVSGALLPALASALHAPGLDAIGARRVYAADTLGTMAGGALFSLVLASRLDSFTLMLPFASAQFGLGLVLAEPRQRAILLILAAAGPLSLWLAWGDLSLDGRSTAWQHPRENVTLRAQSPYGRLVGAEFAGQLTFYAQGRPWLATGNLEEAEETAHLAMSQRPFARRVLIVGGLASGAARELLRHRSVREVTTIEQDPAIVRAIARRMPDVVAEPRLRIAIADARRFLAREPGGYDVIIFALPDPDNALLNRLHTREAFRAARAALAPDGLLAVPLGAYANTISTPFAAMLAVERETLSGSFAHVRALPGLRVWFLASDGAVDRDVAGGIEAAGVRPLTFNRHSLEANFSPDRLAELERAAATPGAVNSDFDPLLLRLSLGRWASQFEGGAGKWLAPLVVIGLLAALASGRTPEGRVLFAAGFSATALEIVLLLGFQNLYGTLYRETGLFIALFMAGLAAGCATEARTPGPQALWLGSLRIALGAALTPLLLAMAVRANEASGSDAPGWLLVPAATIALAWTVGALFALTTRPSPESPRTQAARLFSADLLGAALGAWLASTWLVPRFGVTASCAIIAGLNALAGASTLVARRAAPSALSP